MNAICVIFKDCVDETYLFKSYLNICFKHEFLCVSVRIFAKMVERLKCYTCPPDLYAIMFDGPQFK